MARAHAGAVGRVMEGLEDVKLQLNNHSRAFSTLTAEVRKSVMTKKLGALLNWAGQRGVKTGLVAYRHIVFGIAGKMSCLLTCFSVIE